jgi:hypothetical protein
MQRSRLHRHSITSSALPCNVKGTVMPGVRTVRHEPRGRQKTAAQSLSLGSL